MQVENLNQKGLIIYESKYGATKEYADWLGEDLKLPVMPASEISSDKIVLYDFLLIGTPVYMGRFRIKGWLKENIKAIAGKKVFLFVVNASGPDEKEKREKFILDNVPAEIRRRFDIHFLPGRLIHHKLSFFDKLIVKIGERIEKDPAKRKAMQSDLDEVKKSNLLLLTNAVNNFCFKNSPVSSAPKV